MTQRADKNWTTLFAEGFSKAFDYHSKASRADFWIFYLGTTIINTIIGLYHVIFSDIRGGLLLHNLTHSPFLLLSLLGHFLDGLAAAIDVIRLPFTIATLFCLISLTNRRLRDLSMNTWLTFLFLIPCLNVILALLFFTRKGETAA